MIKKLNLIKHTDNLYDKNGFITNVARGGVVISKINEIIDTIYDMQLAISNLDPDSDWYDGNHIADISKKVDQCEWLGKLCKFWDGNEQMSHLCWGILSTITPTSPAPYCCSLGDGKTFDYEHCEPVKPDDPIIYKGE